MPSANFLPVQNFDMEKGGQIDFDLYLFLPSNQKYILYRRKGSELEREVVQKFADYNVQNFFIRRDDYQNFVKYVAKRIHEIIRATPQRTDTALAASTARALLTSTLSNDDPAMVQAMMGNLYEITSTIIESVIENSDLGAKRTFRRLGELLSEGTDLQRHPVHVSSLAVLLTYGIDYKSEATLYYMAVAGLLHDIGLSKISPRVAAHAHEPESLNQEELNELYSHPLKSLELLKERGLTFPETVGKIILQHHEQFNGRGYPQHLQGSQVSEFAQILHVADAIDEQIIRPGVEGYGLKHRLQVLISNMSRDEIVNPALLKRIEKVIF